VESTYTSKGTTNMPSPTTTKTTKRNVPKPNVPKPNVPAHTEATDTQPTAEDRASQSASTETALTHDEVAQLRAEQRRIREQLKAATATQRAVRDAQRANQPDRLTREITRQHASRQWLGGMTATLVRKRVKYGQAQDTAIAEVMAMFRAQLDSGLAQLDAEQAAQAALPAVAVAPKLTVDITSN